MTINNIDALYIEKGNRKSIVLKDNESLILINSTISKEEVVKIAQHITIE